MVHQGLRQALEIQAGEPVQGRKKDMVGVDQLEPGVGQPRTVFHEGALQELADSIKQHGVLQPLLVRAKGDDSGKYEIIAGERRWRAAQKAQLHEVPAIILEISDSEAFEIALIENLQREDLDPIDEAMGYQRLIDDHDYTQEKLADKVGKSRSHIANMTRLLQLPEKVKKGLTLGRISIGHARAMITADDPEFILGEVIAHNLSVRDTEKLVAESQGREQKTKKRSPKSEPKKDVDTLALEKDLSTKIGMRVAIDSHDGKSGKVSVTFKSLDQLDEILQKLSNARPD